MPIAMNDAGDALYLDDAGSWQPARIAENPQTKERLAFDGRGWVNLPAAKPAPAYGSDEYIQSLAKEFGATPDAIRARVDSSTSAAGVEGMPIIGPVLTHHVAPALSAAMQPLTDAGAAGATFSERKQRNAELDERMRKDFEREHGTLATTAGLVGGAAAIGATGLTAAGARLLGLGAETLPGMAVRGALSGAGIGGADAAVRGEDIGKGAGLGLVLGAGAPVVARAAGTAAAPIISNIRARLNPAGYAASQFGRGITESGQTPQQIADAVAQAAAEGQPQFSVADAMGNAGQRMLSGVARAPGEGRQAVVDFLEQRQAGQGRRVANALAEGFDAPQTAAQTETALTARRAADANTNYGAVRGGATPVDVTPAIQRIDEFLQPGASGVLRPQTAIADDSIEALLRRARGMLTDGRSQVSDFNVAFRAKREMDSLIERATASQQRELIPVRNALDDALAEAAPGYRQARDIFRQQSQAINAVGEGRQAATRGRTENTVPAFNVMRPDQQAAFRAGYVDPLIEQTQGAAVGVNKARPFTSDAFQTESAAMAPGHEQMTRRIGRENTMFETRRQATGGSQTADNLADAAALGDAPALAHQILAGNVGGAIRTGLQAIARHASGSTPAVRAQLAQLLTMRGGTVTGPELQRLLNQATQQVRESRVRAQLATAVAARTAQPALSR